MPHGRLLATVRGLERVELPVGEVEQLVEGARSELGVGDAVEHAGTL